MLKTALVTTRDYARHFAGRSHPERPERIEAMIEMTETMHRDGLIHHLPREATTEEISLCHDPAYSAMVARTRAFDRFDFDPDTHASRDSYRTAMLAAGGVLTAVEAVLDGAADNAFAMVRPPGHHALPDRAMGFCFFNNVAIAAAWLVKHRGAQARDDRRLGRTSRQRHPGDVLRIAGGPVRIHPSVSPLSGQRIVARDRSRSGGGLYDQRSDARRFW